MQCFIYKSLKKAELYLYLAHQDDFTKVPAECMSALGRIEFVMDLELTPERKLAREDCQKVIKSLNDKGFFLQMPPTLFSLTTTLQ